jgi:hypothetical protein
MSDKEYLIMLANGLRDADRMGASTDSPEGARYINISDTLANQIADKLIEIAKGGECVAK